MKTLIAAACLAGLAWPLHAAPADNYPDRPIRIVVPFAAGGGGDFIARAFADKLSATLKQPVIIDNRGGGNTVTGTEAVAKADPDGYTLLIASPALATNPTLLPSLPYKTPDDFAPVGLVITYAMGLAARSSLPVNDIPQLLELARKQPGKVSIATSGEGSATHLAMVLFREATQANLLEVPYRGAGPAMLAVASGQVDLAFTGLSQIKPHLDSGRAKLVATSGLRRLQSAPDVKTIDEQGVKNFEAVVWWGVLAPAGTPRPIIDKINGALRTSLADPEVAKRLEVIDGEVRVSSPEEFDNFLREEITRWSKLLKPSASNARSGPA
ncbi:MAG: tripartite tricarboxylate transporter substrate binding protein [Pigmentiphaga sp.]|uniref:Bug family tripartite tricarboxylate transporter substrate binding protein n=1 Tax=Pigmentiphaga sp. TaxID=1977564 RepID=UPI0029B21D06|nr:tripartite tricarboxylate transporter substrate binding protein [Pigmentiphaga sp.]MDX3907394.1 tripartite tricarboxylate transporter substrate binding protein [Pigmentiphaga sp.]